MVSTLSCCRSTPSDPSPRCGHFKIRTDRIPILFKTQHSPSDFMVANTIVIVSWAVTSFTPLPFSISLVLSLLQLSALALYIKKINAYHQRLNPVSENHQQLSSFSPVNPRSIFPFPLSSENKTQLVYPGE